MPKNTTRDGDKGMKEKMKKALVLLLALVMTCSMSMFAYAAEGDELIPIPPFAPPLIGVTDTTITIGVAPNCEYLIMQVDTGVTSNWLTPSDAEMAAGQMTIQYLQPGGGYLIYGRDKGDPSIGRPAFFLPINSDDYVWPCTEAWCPWRITGAVETPNYPRDIEGVFPGYVYVYDANGNELASLITEYDGYFNGFIYTHCPAGTYKIVCTAQNDPTYRCETTITLPSYYDMNKYILSKNNTSGGNKTVVTPKVTEPATKATEAPTKATEAATKATEAPTTVKETTVAETTATEAETTTVAQTTATEASTEVSTEAATEAQTQAGTTSNSGAQSLWLIIAIASCVAIACVIAVIIRKFVLKK